MSRVIYRWIGFPLFVVAVRLNARADHVTLLSLLLGVLAGLAFAQANYTWTLAGVALLNVALGADAVDGQVARYRREASEFGRWLDSASDVFKLIAVFVGITVGQYRAEDGAVYLALGMVAVAHMFLAYYLMANNKRFSFYRYANAVSISASRRIGLETTLYVFVSAFALGNRLDLMLWVFAGLGAVPWLILLARAWQSHRASL